MEGVAIAGGRIGRRKHDWISDVTWERMQERHRLVKNRLWAEDEARVRLRGLGHMGTLRQGVRLLDAEVKEQLRRAVDEEVSLHRLVKASLRRDKRAYLIAKGAEAAEASAKGDMRTVYALLRQRGSKPRGKREVRTDEQGRNANYWCCATI